MLLAVDIGNTNIKFGGFDRENLISRSSLPTSSTSEELAAALSENPDLNFTAAVVCSVVPEATARLKPVLREAGIQPLLVTNNIDLGLEIKYEPLEAIGTDRLVNSFAAAGFYGLPCIVCSFGTATTIDAVSGERQFLGGLIAPGVRTMARALELHTAQLREVEFPQTASVLNQTTETSIQAGIFFSQVGLVETTVSRMKIEIGSNATVVATGGFASIIAAGTREIGRVDDDLTLKGLRLLHERLTGQ